MTDYVTDCGAEHDPLDTMLDTLRTDIPEMSDQAFTAGRARVRAVVDPIAVVTTLEPKPVVLVMPEQRPLRSPPRQLVQLVASAAAVVALAVGVMVLQSGGNQAPLTAAAAALNTVADNVTATDPALGPGQYTYIATHRWEFGGAGHVDGPIFSWREEMLIETWVPQDESQEWLERYTSTGNTEWLNGTAEEAATGDIIILGPSATPGTSEDRAPCGDFHAVPEETRDPCSFEGNWETPNKAFFDELPRDPAALLERLRGPVYSGGSVAAEPPLDPARRVFTNALMVLDTGLVPADLRAAIYRALALVPELEITDDVANLDGRTGMAVGIALDGVRHDLIIDTATGQYIGERTVATKASEGIPVGKVLDHTAVTIAVVDEIGVPPAG